MKRFFKYVGIAVVVLALLALIAGVVLYKTFCGGAAHGMC
jgi:hypothetical protein